MMNPAMNPAGKFSFLDEGETVRRLGVDRDTLLGFVTAKRLRAYPGVGKGNFFRAADVDALNAELHAGEALPVAPGAEAPAGRKLFDPAYKVHVRLAADLKWYDLEDEDLQAWVREMTADGYQRQRGNVSAVIAKLQRLVALMDEAATGWQHLPSAGRAASGAPPEQAATPPLAGVPAGAQARPARKPLQMFTAPTPAPETAAPPPDPSIPASSQAPAPAPRTKRRSLPMLGAHPTEPGDA
ncbi:MAG: hypothetical protein ACHQ4H_10235 [Ktedonobacterales bacterium]